MSYSHRFWFYSFSHFHIFHRVVYVFPIAYYLPAHRQSPVLQVLSCKVRICKFITSWSMEANPEELAFPLPKIMWVIKRQTSKLITLLRSSQPSSPLICFYYLHAKIKLVKKQNSKSSFHYIFGSSSKTDYPKLINHQRGTMPQPALKRKHTQDGFPAKYSFFLKNLRINIIPFQ